MRRRKNYLVIAMLALTACVTGQRYEEALEAWVGASELELVEGWGPPDSVYEVEGRKYLTYRSEQAIVYPGLPRYGNRYNDDYAYADPFPTTAPTLINQFCKTSFIVEDATVTGWRAEGNACRA